MKSSLVALCLITLAELYPQDRATGFSEGGTRGAFVATRNLSD